MELLEWLHLLNGLVLNQSQISLSVANSLFLAYAILALLTKNAAPLAAFFMCILLVDNYYLVNISEHYMYIMVAVIYLQVFERCLTVKSLVCCVIISLISITLAADAYFYGKNGYYGATNTVIYNNIEYISLCSHTLFICSFISIKRIRDSLRSLSSCIGKLSASIGYYVPL